ncbi:MAG: hypothetical protein ACXWAC_11215 [Usitatibacter sp.]
MRWIGILVALLLGAGAAAAEDSPAAAALRARLQALRPKLAANQFNSPIYLESVEGSDQSKGEIFALVDHPFAQVAPALRNAASWCDILILHLNVKRCVAAPGDANALVVNIGKKFDQPLQDTYLVQFAFRLAAETPDYLGLQLYAPEGPLGTQDYRILIEATPADTTWSLIHLTYSYRYGTLAKLVMQLYLNTAGLGKFGFTEVARIRGRPIYVGGMRGVVERNTMRYFLAIEAYLGSLSLPASEQRAKRLDDWFASSERFALQLHEMDRAEYLASKRVR